MGHHGNIVVEFKLDWMNTYHICGLEVLFQPVGPARSPNLAPKHFCLCGYVKDEIHSTCFPNEIHLMRRAISALCRVHTDVLQNVSKTFDEILNDVARQNNSHIEHL